MPKRLPRTLALAALVLGGSTVAARAQQVRDETTVIDSIEVTGAKRMPPSGVSAEFGVLVGRPVSYRDIQRGITNLFSTGQYEDVRVVQGSVNGKETLRIEVVERALLTGWTLQGADQVPEGSVKGKIALIDGRPYDPSEARRSISAIDSLYKKRGFYFATSELIEQPQPDGTIRVIFNVKEGRHVAISQVVFEGNKTLKASDIAGSMKTKPEGFFWWRKGAYNEETIETDLRERVPVFYGSRGHPDFEVLRDTLVVDEKSGKGTLIVSVDEGPDYEVGQFEVSGNRRFSTDQLAQFFPFTNQATGFLGLQRQQGPAIFNLTLWEDATQKVRMAYYNNGYVYAQVNPVVSRRTTEDGRHIADLRWQIQEGSPAVVNRVLITGNTITHEDVIRRAILVVPGDLFRQDALVRSYQAVSNLGYFSQPMPTPETRPANDQGDLDIIFRVEEKRTGAINFGASLGQGTGLGGFIGLQEPNLFGRGKRVSFQWQFGKNINDFQVSYTDPAIRGSLFSGTLSLHNTRLRYTIADLGQVRTQGGTIQIGIPLRGSRYTRLFTTYTLEQSNYDSPSLISRFQCANCVLSAIGMTLQRDTRIGLPFATGGAMQELEASQNGGVLQGSGNFRRVNAEGRWYAPLAQLGGTSLGGGIQFVLGFTAKTGFVWGDPGPHFRQLFALGGTQFGIALRGYDEFSITPKGFNPRAGSNTATVDAFGQAYLTSTVEAGMRISQMLYASAFFDAGNAWATPRQYNPTRLFRSAGVGVSVVSPLGPLGLDLARGFDRTDPSGARKPGWKVHIRLGQFF